TQRLLILAGPGRLTPEVAEPIDLSDIAEAVRASLASGELERVSWEIEQDVIVRGDFSLLVSVLQNAVDNALKYSPGRVWVEIHGGTGVTVDVLGEGKGVDPRERARLFEPFARGDVWAPGFGVGLALISHVAMLHGGQAEFMDARRGAHLRVSLPGWAS